MRFHCDRCNTRYSIADERVRGKILKIRCKSCSAVITVREGMGDDDEEDLLETAEVARDGEMPREEVSTAELPPTDQWYVSRGGLHHGPLRLAEARAWVDGHSVRSGIYCWRAGFSDWVPVDRIAELGGQPRPPAAGELSPALAAPVARWSAGSAVELPAAGAGSAADAGGHQPQRRPGLVPPLPPLPALNLLPDRNIPITPMPGLVPPRSPQRAAGRTGGMSSALPLPAAPEDDLSRPVVTGSRRRSGDSSFRARDDSLVLEIGEPSRVVKLSMLPPPDAPAAAEPAPRSSTQSLPGVGQVPVVQPGAGRSSGAAPAQGGRISDMVPAQGDSVDEDSLVFEPRRRSMVPLLLGVVTVLLVAGGALVLVLEGSDAEPADPIAGMGGARSFEDLGYQVQQQALGRGAVAAGAEGSGESDSSGGTSPRAPSGAGPGSDRRAGLGHSSPTVSIPGGSDRDGDRSPGDADTSRGAAAASRSMSPEEIMRKASSSQLGLQRCYERARRKDAFLEARNIQVSLTVTPAGDVTDLKLSSHGDHALGRCIKARLRTWTFEPSSDGIHTELSLAFEQ